MILDSLENSGLYTALHPLFSKAFDHIRTTDLLSIPVGEYPLEGNDLIVIVMESDMKDTADALLEVHDKYIDIQVVLQAEETYGWRARSQCTAPRGEMDAENDTLFFDDPHALKFKLTAGDFCIFFPTDAHAPLIGDPKIQVKKCIIKVKSD